AFAPVAFSAKAATRVEGGQTSRSALAATAGAPTSIASNSLIEALRPFIFQLPAISGRMPSVMSQFPVDRASSASRADPTVPDQNAAAFNRFARLSVPRSLRRLKVARGRLPLYDALSTG